MEIYVAKAGLDRNPEWLLECSLEALSVLHQDVMSAWYKLSSHWLFKRELI
jgi:hypothetical protein